jgi:glycosyltransferase involved in cell wall biosynthesis
MRIVTYLPALDGHGGVELTMFETLRELSSRGHRICLFHERPGNLADEFRSFCESIHQGPSPLYSDTPTRDAPRIAMRAIAASRRRPDVVLVNNFSELVWAAGIKALTRAPIVCYLHEFKPVKRSSLRLLGGRVDRFVLSSEFIRGAWSNHGLDGARAEVVHPGISQSLYTSGTDSDRAGIRRELGLPAEAYVVLYIGRLIPEKGVDVLLEAWRSLALPPESARLLIVGLPPVTDSYIDGLRAMSPPGCEWLPMVRNVVPMLQASDVLTLPSRCDEGFGRVIVEAMATGRPAVASAAGGIPEILRGEFEGLLFTRGDSAALAERLLALRDWRVSDPALAAHCANHVAQNFSLGAATDQLAGILASVAG